MSYIVLEKDAFSTVVTSGITVGELFYEVNDLRERFKKATGKELDADKIRVEEYANSICIIYRENFEG